MTTTATRAAASAATESTVSVTPVINGRLIRVGTGFTAQTFREKDFAGLMDPLVLVDHYRMTAPTFGAHPHAGMSAVSVLFEDSVGQFHNRDSLGNDLDLEPGDLYWLKAGAGAVHDESPRPGSKIHGLQVFVNLPASSRHSAPASLHVKAQQVPVFEDDGCRIRVVLGSSNGIEGQQSPVSPMTILDGQINAGASFSHALGEAENALIYVVHGEIAVAIDGQNATLNAGQAVAVAQVAGNPAAPGRSGNTVNTDNAGSAANSGIAPNSGHVIHLANRSDKTTHIALFAAKPFNETFVQKGPFVMGSGTEIAQAEADYAAGKFGRID